MLFYIWNGIIPFYKLWKQEKEEEEMNASDQQDSITLWLGSERNTDSSSIASCTEPLRKCLTQLGTLICFEMALLPSLFLLFELLHCNYSTAGNAHLVYYPSYACWEGSHTAYVVVGIVTMICLVPCALIHALQKNVQSASSFLQIPWFNVIYGIHC
jgi:hypothetical protein